MLSRVCDGGRALRAVHRISHSPRCTRLHAPYPHPTVNNSARGGQISTGSLDTSAGTVLDTFDAVDEKPFRPYAHPNPPPSLVLPSGRSHSLNPSSSAHDFAHTADRILCTSQLRFGPSWKVYTVSVACLPLFLATVAPLYQNAKTKSNLSRNTIVKETRRPPIGQQACISPPSARVKESVLCSLYSGTRGCPLSAPEASNCRIRPSPPNHQTLGCRLSTFTWAYRLFATAHTNYRHSFAAHQELPARLT